MNPVEVEHVTNRPHLREEQLERPELRIVGPVGAAAPELVVHDNAPAFQGQPLQRLEVVVRRAWPAVEAEERHAILRADVSVPGVVAAERDAPFGLPHKTSGSSLAGYPSAPENGVGRDPR
jgi:hypothetical protein